MFDVIESICISFCIMHTTHEHILLKVEIKVSIYLSNKINNMNFNHLPDHNKFNWLMGMEDIRITREVAVFLIDYFERRTKYCRLCGLIIDGYETCA